MTAGHVGDDAAMRAVVPAGLRSGKSMRKIAVDLYGADRAAAGWHGDGRMSDPAPGRPAAGLLPPPLPPGGRPGTAFRAAPRLAGRGRRGFPQTCAEGRCGASGHGAGPLIRTPRQDAGAAGPAMGREGQGAGGRRLARPRAPPGAGAVAGDAGLGIERGAGRVAAGRPTGVGKSRCGACRPGLPSPARGGAVSETGPLSGSTARRNFCGHAGSGV